MALQDLATEYMLQQSRQPTILDKHFAMSDKMGADRLNQQVTLSNLATAEQSRAATGMEMEQSGYSFDLEKQKMQKYGALAAQIQNEPDPAKRYEMAKNWYSIAAEHNDTVGMQMAVPMLKTYAPDQEYGYQEEAAGLGLEAARADIASTKADVGLKGAQAGYYASGGGRGGRGTYKAPPLVGVQAYKAQAKPFVEQLNLRGDEDKAALTSTMYQAVKTLTSKDYGLSVEDAEARVRAAASESISDDGESDMPFFGSDKNKFDFAKFNKDVVNPEWQPKVELTKAGAWEAEAKAQGINIEEFAAKARAKNYDPAEAWELTKKQMQEEPQ